MTESELFEFGRYLGQRSPAFSQWWTKLPEEGIGCRDDMRSELSKRLERCSLQDARDLVDRLIADGDEPRYGADWFPKLAKAAASVTPTGERTRNEYDAEGNEIVRCTLCLDGGHVMVVHDASVQAWKRGEEGLVRRAGARCSCDSGAMVANDRAAPYDPDRMMLWRDFTDLCNHLRVPRRVEYFGAVVDAWQQERAAALLARE